MYRTDELTRMFDGAIGYEFVNFFAPHRDLMFGWQKTVIECKKSRDFFDNDIKFWHFVLQFNHM